MRKWRSAADSEHLAGELAGRFKLERAALAAEALHVNSASLTAISNDYGYDQVFARVLESKGKNGDVLYAMTTSGNSKNIDHALEKAKSMQINTILLTGSCTLKNMQPELHIEIPSINTPRIQEAMMLIGHIICEEVEKQIFS